jgi:SET domain
MIITSPQRVVSQHAFAEVLKDTETGHQYLHSTQAFQPGDIISHFSAAGVFSEPSYLTVQTGDDTHITLQPQFLQYINHSCSPNAFFDTTTMQLVCIAQILPGDQFTFFYPSTEWQMAQPFDCRCSTPACIGQVAGASQIDREVLGRYRLTDYILGKL